MYLSQNKANLDELYNKYKLSNEDHKAIDHRIKEIFLNGKSPVDNPKAIFTIAPPGSGKTGLNGFCVSQFVDDNIVVINNDELRPFHPKANEISKLYPELYTKITNEESKFWTDSLLYDALQRKYNVLYEGTGRRLDLFEKMISKMDGYEIIIRAMAVCDLNCLMSILERYEYQVHEKGWGRLVSVNTFYKAYAEEMLNTVDTLEKTKKAHTVEVYIRGSSPTQPIRIYNSNTKEFSSAKYAIVDGRLKDNKSAIKNYKSHQNMINELLNNRELSNEENEIIIKIKCLYQTLVKEQDER